MSGSWRSRKWHLTVRMSQGAAFSRGRLPLSRHMRWLNVRDNLHQFSLSAIFLASAIKSTPQPLLLCEDLFELRDAELTAALDGTVVLLGGGIEKTIIPVLPHPLVKHSACQRRVL